MAFACPFCNRVLSNRSAYSQHVKRCSENYASSSSEEIFIQNESDIIMSEQEDNSKDYRNNEIIYILDDESKSSPRSNRINDIIQIEIDERQQNINSLTFEEHASIQYEEPASREPEFETEESKFESDETESESNETESESDKTEFESDKTDNESDESEESESAEEETETIPKFPNNTYSDLMTLIIQHNLNNKAGNAIIQITMSNIPPIGEQKQKKLYHLVHIYYQSYYIPTLQRPTLSEKIPCTPIFITLGNIITWRRNKPDVKQLLAYLPIIKAKDDTQKKSEEHKNIVRRTFHKSLKFLLSPLYNEDNGIELELNNRILWCIPRISMIISDWPEACIFSLTYKSTQSNHPCHFCLISKENLSNINLNSNQIEPRSHKNMKLHYKNNTEKNVSIEKVRNFFWNVPDINIYAATVPDRMHHLDLGLFHYQLSFTKALILEQCEKSFIDKINNRIKLIPHYQDLKSFSNGFLHLTLLTASEYRSLMKIIIFIVDNLYQDSKRPNFIKNNKITEIYLKWNKMYLLSRKENYEESDITCLQESINEWAKLFIELFEEYSSSKLQFPKLHSWVFHICSSIREFGAINSQIIIEITMSNIPPIGEQKQKKLYHLVHIYYQSYYIPTLQRPTLSEKIPCTPIFITLGNIITWRRNKPDVKQLLAYLPIIKAKDDTQKKSEEHKNIVRRTFHKSLKFLLSPLYNEDNGIELELNNRILWCIPRISMIISDWPEACIFSLTYKSTQSNHPCHFCLISKENLSNINLNSNQIEPRSHKNMKLHYKNNTEKNVSIEKVRNFFWNVPDINIYAATVPDRMHHLDLGLFHYQLSFTKALILEQCEKSFIDKINNRIKLIPHYQDLKSFSNGFLHLTLLTASEYRSLMKIIIFIVDNLYQDSKRPNFIKNNKITEIYLKWNKMYLLSRKENYEESDITCLQESINEWAKLFIELFEEYSSSKLQFPKLHSWVFHICSSIREFGAINRYTTETYESLHKDYVKKPYKLTNKKKIEKQIMKIIRCKAILIESSSKEIPKTPIALKYSKKLYEFCIQNAEIYIQTRMNDPDLEKEMKLGFEKFLECLDAYLDFYDQKLSEHEEIDIKFCIYSGVTLKYGAKMRANNKFHKRPIFSNIAVEMNPNEIFEYTSDNGICFAQVLLITEIIMNYEEPMHLAFVQ
ncbi:hypothetical protein Glove_558g12 [Diversispora epigaea]|uniref:C2H2-type domain-containing protein n=1 Tax=Diversispora epigaea TaxID=1348612 RepID=A0A397GFA8_9GLOM|nr:hypothetical protein Glove_558g12 [Diversispora epigaea]